MSLSKIYRGVEADDLKEFQFRSFGEAEPLSTPDAEGLDRPSFDEPSIPVAMTPSVPGAASVARQLEEAYGRGRQEGLAAAEQRLESATQALTQTLEDVSRLRDSLARSGSQDMLRLVMAVAEQVIQRSIEVDPNVVLSIIENALQVSVRSDSYRICINPVDLDGVIKQKPLFLASISGLKNISFEADAAISPGGCRVDSELGDVDATIETQLESIRQALNEAITED